MKWFRFFHEVLDDAKVQDLDGDAFKRWINVLCLASQQEPRGSIPADPHLVAFRLRMRLDAACRLLDDLQKRGLLEQHPTISGRLVPHNWEKRQQSSDDSAPRVAKSRGVSPEKNRVNVTAKAPLLKRRLSIIEGEEERDTEIEANASIASATPDAMQAHRNGTFSKVERDAMWEAVVAECGDALMPQAKTRRGKVVGQLLAAHYLPAQIKTAAETYRRRYSVDLTDTALGSHIDRLLSTDDPAPKTPERYSRAATLSDTATDVGRKLKDARERTATGRQLSALHPELRGLPS